MKKTDYGQEPKYMLLMTPERFIIRWTGKVSEGFYLIPWQTTFIGTVDTLEQALEIAESRREGREIKIYDRID